VTTTNPGHGRAGDENVIRPDHLNAALKVGISSGQASGLPQIFATPFGR